jgi:hypothetical protein
MTTPIPSKSFTTTAAVLLGGLGGMALSQYSGPMLWVPGISTTVLFLLFTKTPLHPPHYLGAISVVAGHIVWFLLAGLLVHNWKDVGLDVLVLGAGVVWLWVQPKPLAALLLGIVELASLAYNLFLLSSTAIGSTTHRALTVHCVWRVVAIACLVTGYRTWRTSLKPSALPEA